MLKNCLILIKVNIKYKNYANKLKNTSYTKDLFKLAYFIIQIYLNKYLSNFSI